jgi:hypothetical protein
MGSVTRCDGEDASHLSCSASEPNCNVASIWGTEVKMSRLPAMSKTDGFTLVPCSALLHFYYK